MLREGERGNGRRSVGRMSVGGSTIILSNLPATEGRVLQYEYLKSGGTVHADPKNLVLSLD